MEGKKKKKRGERIGSERGGGGRTEMTGRVGTVEGRAGGAGGGTLRAALLCLGRRQMRGDWQLMRGKWERRERDGRADRRGGKSKREIRGRIREPAYT